ncbi:MAG: hypothetical protein JW719_09325 [Pirellulales bacterium]|nr:hypothetical protein [Pirellulales bacterium]
MPRWLAGTILVLLVLVSGVLVWRRLAGALVHPLPSQTLAAMGVLSACAAAAARWLWLADAGMARNRRLDHIIPWCPGVLLLAIGAAVQVSGASATGMGLFWTAVVFEEIAAAPWMIRRRRRRDQTHDAVVGKMDPTDQVPDCELVDHGPIASVVEALSVESSAGIETAETPAETRPDDQVSQQFVRSRSTSGEDVFSGWLRVEMPVGGRTTNVHVAFCPPFAKAPAIDVRQVDGPPARIKTVQTLAHGARLEVKLNHASEETATVLLRFAASTAIQTEPRNHTEPRPSGSGNLRPRAAP